MGIDVSWQGENGKQLQFVADKEDDLSDLMIHGSFPKSSLLRYIDPFGDTTFNQLQIPTLLKELEEVAESKGKKKELATVIDLVRASKGKTHTYIKFIGD